MSDTPRTDKQKFHVNDAQNIYAVRYEYACELERELTQVRARMEWTVDDNAKKAIEIDDMKRELTTLKQDNERLRDKVMKLRLKVKRRTDLDIY